MATTQIQTQATVEEVYATSSHYVGSKNWRNGHCMLAISRNLKLADHLSFRFPHSGLPP